MKKIAKGNWKKVMREIEVDSDQKKGDLNHQIKSALKVSKACEDEEQRLWKFVNKSVFVIHWKKVLKNYFSYLKQYVAEKKMYRNEYTNFANKFH